MDWPKLWAMMQAFHAAAAPPYGIKEDDSRALMEQIEAQGFLEMTDRAFIAGIVSPNPLNRSEIIGKEFLWWSEDGSGARLQRAFRRWCIEQGASRVDWSCPYHSARVRRFYSKIATPSEVVYSEVL